MPYSGRYAQEWSNTVIDTTPSLTSIPGGLYVGTDLITPAVTGPLYSSTLDAGSNTITISAFSMLNSRLYASNIYGNILNVNQLYTNSNLIGTFTTNTFYTFSSPVVTSGGVTASNILSSSAALGNVSGNVTINSWGWTPNLIATTMFTSNISANALRATDTTMTLLVANNITTPSDLAGDVRGNVVIIGTVTIDQLSSSNITAFEYRAGTNVSYSTFTLANTFVGNWDLGANIISTPSVYGSNLTMITASTEVARIATANVATLTYSNVYANTIAGNVATNYLVANVVLGLNTLYSSYIYSSNIAASNVLSTINARDVTVASNTYSGPLSGSNIVSQFISANVVAGTTFANLVAGNLYSATMLGNVINQGNTNVITVVTSTLASNVQGANNFTTVTLSVPTVTGRLVGSNPIFANIVYAPTISGFWQTYSNSFFIGTLGATLINTASVNTAYLSTSNIYFSGTANVGNLVSGTTTVTTAISAQTITGTMNAFLNNITTNTITAQNLYSVNASLTNVLVSGNIWSAYTTTNVQTNTFITQGTLYAQNIYANLFSTNVFLSGNIYYPTDYSATGIFYQPSVSNASTISNSLGSYISSKFPGAPVNATMFPGPTGYSGSVLLPDGRAVFVPADANTIAIYNSRTNLLSSLTPSGNAIPTSTAKWSGGVLLPTGNVFFVPQTYTQAAQYDPYNNILSLGPTLTGYAGGVLVPSGNVVCVPYTSTSVAEVNPVTGATKTVAHGSGGASPYCFSGALLPTGNVFLAPYSGNAMQYSVTAGVSNIAGYTAGTAQYSGCCYSPLGELVLVPASGSNVGHVSMSGSFTASPPSGSFSTACMLGNGKMLFGGTSLGVYDVYTNTLTTVSGGTTSGGVTLSDGRAVFAPGLVVNGGSSIDPRVLYSPYLNKGL